MRYFGSTNSARTVVAPMFSVLELGDARRGRVAGPFSTSGCVVA
jgi:hypothetical protein